MKYNDILILIPSYSIEDLSSEVNEQQAVSLLNAFATAWHPVLLAETQVLPSWHHAEAPPESAGPNIVLVPEGCGEKLPKGWIDQRRSEHSLVLWHLGERKQWVEAALEPFDKETVSKLDPELVADFHALGTCYLLMEIVTRHMHYYSDVDEAYLQKEAVAAAEATVANDAEAAVVHLRNCFETLTEAREHFYPIESFLIDLCVCDEGTTPTALKRVLESAVPVNVVTSAEWVSRLTETRELLDRLRKAWELEQVEVCGGAFREASWLVQPLEYLLWQFRRGLSEFQRVLGRRPAVWAQRLFGLNNQMPQILERFGFEGAVHVALDEGRSPENADARFRWQGCDGSVIEALGAKPLAAHKALSYFELAVQLAESMDSDPTAATAVLVRRADSDIPWLKDLQRMDRYAPALGRFVPLRQFLEESESLGQLMSFSAGQYVSTALLQMALTGRAPISSYTEHWRRIHQWRTGRWLNGLLQLLKGQTPEEKAASEGLRLIEEAFGRPENGQKADGWLQRFVERAADELSRLILSGAEENNGWLVFNPLSFERSVVVELPEGEPEPEVGGPVVGTHFNDNRRSVLVKVPGCGFAWFPKGKGKAAGTQQPFLKKAVTKKARKRVPLAEENCLRNEFFEAYVNKKTGGLLRLSTYERAGNRLSQQLAFRFVWPRVVGADESGQPLQSHYSQMRCHRLTVTSSGGEMGEIVSEGELFDQVEKVRLARFRQTFRIWRHRPVLELDIQLEPERLPDAARPWASYYTSRFAWNDSLATLTRSVLNGAHPLQDDRVEAAEYLEIASDRQRTTLLFGGMPFHRLTGPRMLDTLLISAGETARHFHIWITVDQDFPLEAAWDMLSPVVLVPTSKGPPCCGPTGWLFHVDHKNVQFTELGGLLDEPPTVEPSKTEQLDEEEFAANGFSSQDNSATDTYETATNVLEPDQERQQQENEQRKENKENKENEQETNGQEKNEHKKNEHEMNEQQEKELENEDAGEPTLDKSVVTEETTTETQKRPNSPEREAAEQVSRFSDRSGFCVRLLETEGQACTTWLRCFRQPTAARKRDFEGRTLQELSVQGDGVQVPLSAYEIAEIEVYFD